MTFRLEFDCLETRCTPSAMPTTVVGVEAVKEPAGNTDQMIILPVKKIVGVAPQAPDVVPPIKKETLLDVQAVKGSGGNTDQMIILPVKKIVEVAPQAPDVVPPIKKV